MQVVFMGDELRVAYLELDAVGIVKYVNPYFLKLFGFSADDQIVDENIEGISAKYSILNEHINKIITLNITSKSAFLVAQNYSFEVFGEKGVLILYVSVEKLKDSTIVRYTNWLTWLHRLNQSLNKHYKSISQINENQLSINILSEAHCFKALYPLLAHIPDESSGQISSRTYFNILKIFNKKRGENIYSKDYNRDTLSRIKNALKKDFGITDVDISGIIKYDQLVNIKIHDEFLIPYMSLKSTMVISPVHDYFLEAIMKKYTQSINV